MLFNSFGLVVAKRVFKLNFSSEIYNYDNSTSRTESVGVYNTEELIVFMYSCQTDHYLPSREKMPFLKGFGAYLYRFIN